MWGSFSNEQDFTLDLFDKFGTGSSISCVMNDVIELFRECGGKLDEKFDSHFLTITKNHLIVKKTCSMFQKMTNDERKLFLSVFDKVLVNSQSRLARKPWMRGLDAGIKTALKLEILLKQIPLPPITMDCIPQK